jgi:sterol 14-demethylase
MYEKYADEIATLYYDVENNAFSPLLLIAPWLPTPTNLKVKRSRQRLLQLISDHVQQRLQNPEKYVSKCQDWLQVCIQWGIEDGVDPMRLALSLGNVIVSAMFAAHTNTGGTMGWTLAHLAQDKELQESVRQEVLHFVEKENVTALSPAIINKLSLLDSCMKETQRRYPLLFLFRQTVEPQEFEGYYIPAGEYVCISPLITHMSSELWENPTQYRPQRFLNEEMIQKQIDNKTYIQFGFGLHRCLGEKFANVVLKTCWFNLLKDYALEPKSEMSPPNYKRAVGMPFSTHPIFIAVKKREHQLNDFPSPQQQQNQ